MPRCQAPTGLCAVSVTKLVRAPRRRRLRRTVDAVPRPPRTESPHGIYHVTSRGNDGRAIFFDDFDRTAFLAILERTVERHGWLVYAYCLMTNHYHLVLQIREGGLSQGMCELNGSYSRRTQRRYETTGHLLRNRFYAGQIEREGHLLEACRYLVLNPVRAGMCTYARQWTWSSYRASAGLDFPPRFLAATELLRLFGTRREAAGRAWREYVREGDVRRGRVPVPGTGFGQVPRAAPLLAATG